MKKIVCVLLLLPALAVMGWAGPVTLYDTITGAPTYELLSPINLPPSYWGIASSFSTGDSAFTLQGLDLLLGPRLEQSSQTLLNVYLCDDADGPNEVLQTLGTISDTYITSTGQGEYSWSTSYALDPSTRYWIAVFPTTQLVSTSGWGFTFNLNAAALSEFSWNSYNGVSSNSENEAALQMRISGSEAVPEPTSFLLAAVGIGALAFWRRRSAA